jgi:RNA-directed DNA polymerase
MDNGIMSLTVPVLARRKEEVQSLEWIETSIWTERMLAALGNGVKGGKWYSLMDKLCRYSTLKVAWLRVKANRGSAGVDKVSIEQFEAQADKYLLELESALKAERYQVQCIKRVYIPKTDGKMRPLGIPTVKDRIVQMGLKLVIEPIFESEFLDVSYGFRPQRGCKDALRQVNRQLKSGLAWVVDADIQGYFDNIPHERLLSLVAERISDQAILTLIKAYLQQDIMDGVKQWTPIKGSPQGAVISPLLANIYLHGLDKEMTRQGYQLIRYADDSVVLCGNENEAKKALNLMREWMEEQGLTLHPDKTHIGDSRVSGQGFEFLGYRFECGRRYVRNKSYKALRDKIRDKTKRTRGNSMKAIIDDLNPMLRGWFGYFKHAYYTTFSYTDGFIRRRLRAIRRKQQKRPGMGRCHKDHIMWPNSYFAKLGLFTMKEAWELARQPRCGNY